MHSTDRPLRRHPARGRMLFRVVVVGVAIMILLGAHALRGAPAARHGQTRSVVTATAQRTMTTPSAAPPPAAGTSRSQRPLVLAGLGDSVPEAAGCDCTSFVSLYGARITHETGVPVTVDNLGQGGQTSAGLLTALTNAGPEATTVQAADIITVTIGANDFDPTPLHDGTCGGQGEIACYTPVLSSMQRNVAAIIARIHALRAGLPTTVLVTDYWAVFEDGGVAANLYGATFLAADDLLTRHVNTAIAHAATARHATFVDLYAPFKGTDGDADDTNLLAADGDHPDQAGHQTIADILAARYLPPRT